MPSNKQTSNFNKPKKVQKGKRTNSSEAAEQEDEQKQEQVKAAPAETVEYINLGRRTIEKCKNKDCLAPVDCDGNMNRLPHYHQHPRNECINHFICKMQFANTEHDDENTVPVPFNVQYMPQEKDTLFRAHVTGGASRKQNESQDYVKKIVESRKTNRVDEKTQKIAITEYSLDHWRAQNQGLNIDNLPARKPAYVKDKELWHELKRKEKRNQMKQLQLQKDQNKLNEGHTPDNKNSEPNQDGVPEDSDEGLDDLEKRERNKKFDITQLKPDQLKPYIYPKSQKVRALVDDDHEEMLAELALDTKKKSQAGIADLVAQKMEKVGEVSPKKRDSAQNQNEKNMKYQHEKLQLSPQDKPKLHFLLDPEIANRVHSPFLNIMKREDITSCVSKMKQIKKMIAAQHQKQEEIASEQVQDKEEHTKGKAKYIVMKKRSKSMGVREHTEATNRQTTAVTNSNTNGTDEHTAKEEAEGKQELTTFQKLEALRSRKPIHALMKAAAQSMPKNHFQEVKRQQMEMLQRENEGQMKEYYKYKYKQQQYDYKFDENKLKSAVNRECPANDGNHRTATTPLIVNILARDTPCFVENVDVAPASIQSEDKVQHLASLNSSQQSHGEGQESCQMHDQLRLLQEQPRGRAKFKARAVQSEVASRLLSERRLHDNHDDEGSIVSDQYQRKKKATPSVPTESQLNDYSYHYFAPPQRADEFHVRYVDNPNQQWSREYNQSILSPSINFRKTQILKSIKHSQPHSRNRSTGITSNFEQTDKEQLMQFKASSLDYTQKRRASIREVEQNKQLEAILTRFQLTGKQTSLKSELRNSDFRSNGQQKHKMNQTVPVADGNEDMKAQELHHVAQDKQKQRLATSFDPGHSMMKQSALTQEADAKLEIKPCLVKSEPTSPGVVKTSKRQSKASFINIVDQKANLNQTQKSIGEVDLAVPPLSTAVQSSIAPARERVIRTRDLENELPEPRADELHRAYQHVSVILDLQAPVQQKITKNVFECAEYWFMRGYQSHTGKNDLQTFKSNGKGGSVQGPQKLLQQEQADQALDFYFQGLRKDFWHYGCCYNIGVTFFQRGKNRNALKWFRFAKLLDPSAKEPCLGEAAAAFKLGHMDESIEIIRSRPGQKQINEKRKRIMQEFNDSTFTQSESISKTTKQNQEKTEEADGVEQQGTGRSSLGSRDVAIHVELEIENQFAFLKTICYKKAMKYERAQKEYHKLKKIFNSRTGEKLAKQIFMSLMLPMHVNRKLVEDAIYDFTDCVNYADTEQYWDNTIHEPLNKILHYKTGQWSDIEKAILWLREMPLFKRMVKQGFSTDDFRQILPHLTVVEKVANDIVFDEPDFIYIVLNGRVVLRFHEEDPLEYQNIAQYTPGKVIGHDTLDTGISQLGQVFPIVISNKCLLLKVKQSFFDERIWKRSLNTQMEVRIRQISQFPFMRDLSDQTLYLMMYEYGKVLLYPPGKVVMEQHPRSPLNLRSRYIYDQEYGHHMKVEANNLANQNSKQGDPSSTKQGNTSAFGSFFQMVNAKKKQRLNQGITEEMFLKLHSKPQLYRRGNEPDSHMRSLCFVLEGSCEVINKADNSNLFQLTHGNHFGASDLLHIVDTDFLGDIISGEQGAKILVIPKPDQVIQQYERKKLRSRFEHSLDTLKFVISSKYALDSGYLDCY